MYSYNICRVICFLRKENIQFAFKLETCSLHFSRWALSGMETEADNMLGIQVSKFIVFNETEKNNHLSVHSSIMQ